MALIASVSGIRGTIGGTPGENLTPEDIVRFTAAYATLLKQHGASGPVVLGRDGRMSGPMVEGLVMQTLLAMGLDVLLLGLSTTPTVEMAVVSEKAAGGIILTASHNPAQWNALKLLNASGEFLSAEEGQVLLELAQHGVFTYAPADAIGRAFLGGDGIDDHVRQILALPMVNVEAIRQRKFHVVVDCINSTGALAIPALLRALEVDYTLLNPEVTGRFAHNPEPLPEHLTGLCSRVAETGADLGIAVDPDVDRLALVCEDGSWFGEEYTLVAAADHVLRHRPGPVVSNLSSSRALTDLAARYGQQRYTASVGEVHVVRQMKAVGAVIGGEGNGGVILPDLHYGRDALVGIALILTLLAERACTASALRAGYPDYYMAKKKVDLLRDSDWERLQPLLLQHFEGFPADRQDGLKIDLEQGWCHIRKSNTEPILRIYTEMPTMAAAEALADQIIQLIRTSSEPAH